MSKVKCILHSTFFILNLIEALILHSERSVLTSLNFKRFLKPNSEECADAPFDVVNGKTLFVTDIGEIENH